MNAIAEALGKVTAGPPVEIAGLTMVPLLTSEEREPGYATLDEALAGDAFKVTEVSEAGSVPHLTAINEWEKPVLLLDGEELVGAKQNRIVNLSILVPAKRQIEIPVACVEAGRWRHQSRQFGSAQRAHYASGRAMKSMHVSRSMRTTARPTADQGALWDDIDRKLTRHRAVSESSAMAAVFEKKATDLQEISKCFAPQPRQSGAAFWLDGRFLGLDLVDCPSTWRKLAAKLSESYGLEALDKDPDAEPTAERGESARLARLLTEIQGLEQERYPAAGEGEDVRLSGPSLSGGALLAQGELVHLAVFPAIGALA